MEERTVTRPLIRKRDGWWRVFYGHTTYHSGDYFISNVAAYDAAIRHANKRSSLA